MMLPIPRAGTLREVSGRMRHSRCRDRGPHNHDPPGGGGRAASGGRPIHLGFMFARADTPGEVEAALREAHRRLEVVIE
jgi:hypothetical protein